jgi:hypothetical protein
MAAVGMAAVGMAAVGMAAVGMAAVGMAVGMAEAAGTTDPRRPENRRARDSGGERRA